jgi:tetratricopeptide (TPR) repeat protein
MKSATGLIALAVLAVCAPPSLAQTPAQPPTEDDILEAAIICYNPDDKEAPDAIIAACTTALRDPKLIKDDRIDMLFGRALGYEAKGDLDKSLADYNEGIKLDPSVDELYFGRGIILHKMKKYQEALVDYTEVLKRDPKNGDAYGNRGNVYQYGLEDYDAAIVDYNASLTIRPHAMEFANRGSAYLYGIGDNARAISDFDAALKLDASNAATWGMRCWAKTMQATNLDQAIADCDKAMSLGLSKDAVIVSSRGIANYKRKKYQAAWNDFDAALKTEPGNAEHFYGRGLAEAQLGRNAEAQADIAAAVKADPDIAAIFADYGIKN